MKRLFIAAPISEDLRTRIKEIEQRTHLSIPWIPLENLHLTLLFLGDIEEVLVPHIQNALQIFKADAFSVSATHVDYSPNQYMVWLYINQDKNFQQLLMQLDKMLYEHNIKYEKSRHPFVPHINLVRLNHEMNIPVEHTVNIPIDINELCLFESILQRPFVSYVKLGNVLLQKAS